MPINDGEQRLFVSRPTTGTMLVHPRDEESLVASAKYQTDADYADFHERLGHFAVFREGDPIMPYGMAANEYLARRRFGTNPPTETPVDRWMERLRGRAA